MRPFADPDDGRVAACIDALTTLSPANSEYLANLITKTIACCRQSGRTSIDHLARELHVSRDCARQLRQHLIAHRLISASGRLI